MAITKLPPIGHVGIVVADMDKALAELRELYGLPGLDTTYSFKPMRVWAWGKEISGCEIKICMTDWTDTLKMEILQPVFGAIEHERFVRECGGGMHHTAYYVKEYGEYREFILKKGGEIIFESETEDDKGYRRCCYARFPQTKMVVEILEYAWFRK
ncbi:MAG: VOC family protein [Deltaproteobacteria bacterium]|nr:VOC family protein [Deltaproteobacteria bacterium]